MLDDALKTRIDNEIASETVVLFMKGTPVFPQCGFSAAVVGVLSHLGVKFRGINVLEDDTIREGIKAYSDWPTIPQLYVKGEFVGGCDIIREMYESGELTEMFQTHGVDARQARPAKSLITGALGRINDVAGDKGTFGHHLGDTHPVPVIKLLSAQRLGRQMLGLLAPIGNGVTIDPV